MRLPSWEEVSFLPLLSCGAWAGAPCRRSWAIAAIDNCPNRGNGRRYHCDIGGSIYLTCIAASCGCCLKIAIHSGILWIFTRCYSKEYAVQHQWMGNHHFNTSWRLVRRDSVLSYSIVRLTSLPQLASMRRYPQAGREAHVWEACPKCKDCPHSLEASVRNILDSLPDPNFDQLLVRTDQILMSYV